MFKYSNNFVEDILYRFWCCSVKLRNFSMLEKPFT